MRKKQQHFYTGIVMIILFGIWTYLIQAVDVQPAGETATNIGFATFNCGFHTLTGVHMGIYALTDWLGLVPVFVCLLFGLLGLSQLVKRKQLRNVDPDLLLLGVYYVLVIMSYLLFETYPINYRPILIEGRMEASYPSSTTLLVLSVMPTLVFQTRRRIHSQTVRRGIVWGAMLFSLFMVVGRLVAGVHWFTDIVGSILLSTGLFQLYKAVVLCCKK